MAAERKQKQKKVSPDISRLAEDMGRKPPQAIDIEEAVLAAMMLEPDVVTDTLDTLNTDCFYKEAIARFSRRSARLPVATTGQTFLLWLMNSTARGSLRRWEARHL